MTVPTALTPALLPDPRHRSAKLGRIPGPVGQNQEVDSKLTSCIFMF